MVNSGETCSLLWTMAQSKSWVFPWKMVISHSYVGTWQFTRRLISIYSWRYTQWDERHHGLHWKSFDCWMNVWKWKAPNCASNGKMREDQMMAAHLIGSTRRCQLCKNVHCIKVSVLYLTFIPYQCKCFHVSLQLSLFHLSDDQLIHCPSQYITVFSLT